MLRSGRSGLEAVYRTPTTTVFSVPSPRPIVTPPARVVSLGYTSIRIRVPSPGTYRLAVTYAPYWHTAAGCLRPTPDGMTQLTVWRRGPILVRFSVTPSRALAELVGETSECR